MQSQNRFFDDISKVLNGAAGTFAGMAREVQDVARERAQDFVGNDWVRRDEFEVVKDMLAATRAELAALKAKVGGGSLGDAPAVRPAAAATTTPPATSTQASAAEQSGPTESAEGRAPEGS